MSISDQQGGPAFPFVYRAGDSLEVYPGMTLRDWFAGQALTGFMQAQGWIGYMETPEHREHLLANYARDSYAVADAMLAERDR